MSKEAIEAIIFASVSVGIFLLFILIRVIFELSYKHDNKVYEEKLSSKRICKLKETYTAAEILINQWKSRAPLHEDFWKRCDGYRKAEDTCIKFISKAKKKGYKTVQEVFQDPSILFLFGALDVLYIGTMIEYEEIIRHQNEEERERLSDIALLLSDESNIEEKIELLKKLGV